MYGEGEYNLNDLKVVEGTDSFLAMDQDVKGCQNVEALDGCSTKYYRETVVQQCKCIPFNIRKADEKKK